MAIRFYTITATSTGGAGTSSGSADSAVPITGTILGVYLDYTGQPATTDVTLATKNAPVQTLLTKADNATDGWAYPHFQGQDSAGAAVAGLYENFVVGDYLTLSIAQGNNGGTVAATVKVQE